jgi:hypothetical protein
MINKSKYADALSVSEPFRAATLRIYLKTKCQTFARGYHFPITDYLRGQGMVHETQRGTATRRLWSSANGCRKTNDQQAQQAFINAAIGMLAIRDRSSPNRRSDLLLPYGSLATREFILRRRVSI